MGLRTTATLEKEYQVEARTRKDAQQKAEERAATEDLDVSRGRVKRSVTRVRRL